MTFAVVVQVGRVDAQRVPLLRPLIRGSNRPAEKLSGDENDDNVWVESL